MPQTWVVTTEPVGENKGKNTSGIAVCVSDGEGWSHEVARVAFRRSESSNPGEDFGDVLMREVEKAEQAVEVMNDALDDFERARAEEIMKARERVAEVLGDSKGLV